MKTLKMLAAMAALVAVAWGQSSGAGAIAISQPPPSSGPGSGDVVGPASSTDNALVRWDGTTGKLIKDSSVTLSATAMAFPSTATAGLQLYNTADQTTNVQRLEALYGASVAQFGTRTLGTGVATPLHLFSQSSTAGATYSRLDLQNSVFPFMRQGLFTTASGATTATFSSAGQTVISLLNYTNGAASGTNVGLSLTPTYNQASGTAANTDLLINRTETAVGSGNQYLIQAQVGGADRVLFTTGGVAAFNGSLRVGAASVDPSTRLRVSTGFPTAAWGANGTALRVDAATYTDTSTAGSGTAASAVFSSFAQPTLAATNSSVTTTDAATVYIANAPANGTNNTITNPYALWVDDGNVRLDGALITTPQALSGAGAVNLTTTATFYTSTGGAQALTLANGTAGQIKYIVHQVDGGSGVLTPTSAIGFTTITFTNVGDSVTLIYTSSGWAIVGILGAVPA